MKIIFEKDVPRVGRREEIKDVNDGYALNFLIPQKLAVKATPEALAAHDAKKAAEAAEKLKIEEKYIAVIRDLQKEPLAWSAKVNEKGHLFQSVTMKQVSEKIASKSGTHIPEEMLHAEHVIKEAGEHRVTVNVGDQKLIFKINVIKE